MPRDADELVRTCRTVALPLCCSVLAPPSEVGKGAKESCRPSAVCGRGSQVNRAEKMARDFVAASTKILDNHLATMEKKICSRKPVKGFVVQGSGAHASPMRWSEWVDATRKIAAVGVEMGVFIAAPIIFCPYGRWLHKMPPDEEQSELHGVPIPSCRQVAESSFTLNLWDRGDAPRLPQAMWDKFIGPGTNYGM